MAYEIHCTDGTQLGTYETYQAALDACRAEWPEAEIGHDGDLTSGGDRTLVWENEEDSIDDDGARAVASIYEVAIAAVGSDGTRPVVWGIGRTEAEAREDAAGWLTEADAGAEVARLEYHPITPGQAALVAGGSVAWPVEGTKTSMSKRSVCAGEAEAVTVRGVSLWRKREGSRAIYTWREEGQAEPSPWAIWSHRARDVSRGDVAGTGAGI